MNIKEHIEAGHYPKDDMGFPLVRREAGDARIISTTGPKPEYEIVGCDKSGRFLGWDVDGNGYKGFDPIGSRLLPPPPRKVAVTRWVEHDPAGAYFSSTWASDEPSGGVSPRPGCVVIALTGSYEEPWK